jgi:RNA polymerase sigma-70 factor (ECF subfamily)
MFASPPNTAEKRFADWELVRAIETAIEALPARLRVVFMLRDVEQMNVPDTAECLGITEYVVETRLRRARALLRQKVTREMGVAVHECFALGVARCDHIVATVRTRIEAVSIIPPDAAAEQQGVSRQRLGPRGRR